MLLFVAIGYGIGCIAAGIELAQVTIHMPREPVAGHTALTNISKQFDAPIQNASITAADDAVLKGWFLQPFKSRGETVVILHGTGGNRSDFSGFSEMFLSRGYAVLLLDSRGHGESGGSITTYGVLERDDVRRWVNWARQRDAGCTYLLGESMGAAIALQAAAMSSQVCAVAVESPYATFRAVGYERLGWMTGVGPLFWKTLGRPIIEIAIAYTWLRYGVYLPNANPKAAVEHSSVPSLLIAGTTDRDILMHNATELERVCSSHCALWIVPGADHGGASQVAPQEFEDRVVTWFETHDPSKP